MWLCKSLSTPDQKVMSKDDHLSLLGGSSAKLLYMSSQEAQCACHEVWKGPGESSAGKSCKSCVLPCTHDIYSPLQRLASYSRAEFATLWALAISIQPILSS